MTQVEVWAKRIGIALLKALAAFAISIPVACLGLTLYFDHLYPQDGQNGLGGLFFSFPVGCLLGLLVFAVSIIRSYQNADYDESTPE